MKFRTILVDPPWPQGKVGRFADPKHGRPDNLPYRTMTLAEIAALPVDRLADYGAHLWLWTTNQHLRNGFDLMRRWGFKYLAPITWVKPSGFGAYFVHRTQTLLFGYRDKCRFNRGRYRPTVLNAPARRHSQKPECSYELIEAISDSPRLELFARQQRPGWDVWGDQVESTIQLPGVAA